MMAPKCSVVENDGELMLMALHTHLLPQQEYCEQKFVQHGPITIAINCNGLSLLLFQINGLIMPLDQNPHQTVTDASDYPGIHCRLVAGLFERIKDNISS